MSDTIIDVVPRIHSDFVMPAIETVAANPVETPVVVESQRKKIMMDIGNFCMKYKVYIIIIIVAIIILMYVYYYFNTKRKKQLADLANQIGNEENNHSAAKPVKQVKPIKIINKKEDEEYDTSIDTHINKIINQPPVTEAEITNIDDQINNIISQTEISDIYDSHIDQKIDQILKNDDIVTNNLLQPKVEPFVNENIVSSIEEIGDNED